MLNDRGKLISEKFKGHSTVDSICKLVTANHAAEQRFAVKGKLDECEESLSTLRSQLRQKRNKYKEEELANKNERLNTLQRNLEMLQ